MKHMAGGVEYELTYKKVKRLNLRVKADGSVAVSAPRRVSLGEIDRFVSSHAVWVRSAKERVKEHARRAVETPETPELDRWTDEECLNRFTPVFERYYRLFLETVPEKPVLKVRFMKSRWGVCHLRKHQITLNKQLMEKPLEALEYVVLHELAHFLFPDHQKGFHAQMAVLMPDYWARRRLLSSAISPNVNNIDK